ncbi:type III PLP-dependent enzyme [Octadecabacter sp. CECT 8868]|uniref:type III PLP-dependent enzyme n=1 Tax=Octadecabacter algicola TaxID=2909342 RepID=UPI001F35C497|nr:type III PLP-dependent enzyme [Octadecabacter algicola]MCF2906697.1 type III PLP-dependent enzyme [Octadecabacter algicola]
MTPEKLLDAVEGFSTPLFVYDLDAILDRLSLLKKLFDGRFGVSYAIKANPNMGLLRALQPQLEMFDASSILEVRRAIATGMKPEFISFSGPAKRKVEIHEAVDLHVGELILESLSEAEEASAYAQSKGLLQPCLVRINPLHVPRKFGASMARTASQFGIDEEQMGDALPQIAELAGLNLVGFHIYSGTNCLDPEAIAENFENFARIFEQAQAQTGIEVHRLVFGSGFGIQYLPDETQLDHEALPALVNPIVDALLQKPGFEKATCNLELGRWLVGPFGWLLTRTISEKSSRGSEIRTCDAGFNNHLAACGMMGSVFRRNWVFQNISNPQGKTSAYMLVGPLCTSIDRLAVDVELAEVTVGDVIAIEGSGAYGLTASPSRFISHPEPREVTYHDGRFTDASETERHPLTTLPA